MIDIRQENIIQWIVEKVQDYYGIYLSENIKVVSVHTSFNFSNYNKISYYGATFIVLDKRTGIQGTKNFVIPTLWIKMYKEEKLTEVTLEDLKSSTFLESEVFEN